MKPWRLSQSPQQGKSGSETPKDEPIMVSGTDAIREGRNVGVDDVRQIALRSKRIPLLSCILISVSSDVVRAVVFVSRVFFCDNKQ